MTVIVAVSRNRTLIGRNDIMEFLKLAEKILKVGYFAYLHYKGEIPMSTLKQVVKEEKEEKVESTPIDKTIIYPGKSIMLPCGVAVFNSHLVPKVVLDFVEYIHGFIGKEEAGLAAITFRIDGGTPEGESGGFSPDTCSIYVDLYSIYNYAIEAAINGQKVRVDVRMYMEILLTLLHEMYHATSYCADRHTAEIDPHGEDELAEGWAKETLCLTAKDYDIEYPGIEGFGWCGDKLSEMITDDTITGKWKEKFVNMLGGNYVMDSEEGGRRVRNLRTMLQEACEDDEDRLDTRWAEPADPLPSSQSVTEEDKTEEEEKEKAEFLGLVGPQGEGNNDVVKDKEVPFPTEDAPPVPPTPPEEEPTTPPAPPTPKPTPKKPVPLPPSKREEVEENYEPHMEEEPYYEENESHNPTIECSLPATNAEVTVAMTQVLTRIYTHMATRCGLANHDGAVMFDTPHNVWKRVDVSDIEGIQNILVKYNSHDEETGAHVNDIPFDGMSIRGVLMNSQWTTELPCFNISFYDCQGNVHQRIVQPVNPQGDGAMAKKMQQCNLQLLVFDPTGESWVLKGFLTGRSFTPKR